MRRLMPDPGPSGLRQFAPSIFHHHWALATAWLTLRARRGWTKRWKTNDQPYLSASVRVLRGPDEAGEPGVGDGCPVYVEGGDLDFAHGTFAVGGEGGWVVGTHEEGAARDVGHVPGSATGRGGSGDCGLKLASGGFGVPRLRGRSRRLSCLAIPDCWLLIGSTGVGVCQSVGLA